MAHGHVHAPEQFGVAFAAGVSLNALFVVTEVVFGLRAGSVALLADAGHNVADVIGLLMAWGAVVLATKPASATHTYGFRSSTILAALANGLLLLVVVGAIGWEAIRRIGDTTPVQGWMMMSVAAVGIVINGSVALMFVRGSRKDLNLRSAFLHMATDALMSLSVLVAGLLIALTGWRIIDPVLSLLIVGIVVFGTWGLLKEAARLIMHAVPPGLDLGSVRSCLEALPGIEAVHDLHVWAMSTTEFALTAHLVAPSISDTDELLRVASSAIHENFGIHHSTFQVERGDPANLCPVDCEPLRPL